MKCTTGLNQADQEHKTTMAETAHRLHETFSQRGESALTMDDASILKKMLPLDFIVTREAAGLPPRHTFTTCARWPT
jgi:hypothetical protein